MCDQLVNVAFMLKSILQIGLTLMEINTQKLTFSSPDGVEFNEAEMSVLWKRSIKYSWKKYIADLQREMMYTFICIQRKGRSSKTHEDASLYVDKQNYLIDIQSPKVICSPTEKLLKNIFLKKLVMMVLGTVARLSSIIVS